MKYILSYIVFFLFVLTAVGQQLPQFSYFTYNYINYNPAVTGSTPCLEVRVGYRRQWSGLDDGPRTAFAVGHGKFGQKRHNFHGAGGYVETDESGPFSYTSLYANYAYHMRLNKGYTLASGISIGFSQNRIDFGSMTLEQQDIDPVISSSFSDIIFPQIALGFWLYRQDRFYGLSMRQLKQNDVTNLEAKSLRRHYTLAYGRAIKMTDEMTFKPALLVNYVGKSRASFEAQGLLDFRQKVALGLGVRGGSGISGLIKLDVIKYITLVYAYDLTLSKMRYAGSSSHEITIGFRACAAKDKLHVPCAAYD